MTTSDCPQCSPAVTLDLTQGQRVLEHIGAHILHDPSVIHSTEPLCGLCLRSSSLCQYFITKGKGANGKQRIDQRTSKGCLMSTKFSYSVAAESTASSPCSNIPIPCPVCPRSDPAVWKYFLKVHFEEKHKNPPLGPYIHLWALSNFEKGEMKSIWNKRSKIMVKRTKRSKVMPLVISENYRANIPNMYVH